MRISTYTHTCEYAYVCIYIIHYIFTYILYMYIHKNRKRCPEVTYELEVSDLLICFPLVDGKRKCKLWVSINAFNAHKKNSKTKTIVFEILCKQQIWGKGPQNHTKCCLFACVFSETELIRQRFCSALSVRIRSMNNKQVKLVLAPSQGSHRETTVTLPHSLFSRKANLGLFLNCLMRLNTECYPFQI